jgi:hypothetical protein
MNNYIYYLIFILLLNCLLFKFYFLNLDIYIQNKNNLKKNYINSRNDFMNQTPELLTHLVKNTKDLNIKLNDIKKKC